MSSTDSRREAEPSLYMLDADRSHETAAAAARVLALRLGEVAVLGLGASGVAAARLLRHLGIAVYASDGARTPDTLAAEASLSALGVGVDVGTHDLARIARTQLLVVSPGIPPEAPAIAAARDAGVPVVSEVEIGLRLMPAVRTIAVTGTNGKTTTTALIGHLLRALGLDAEEAGNIGRPVCAVALQATRPDWLALELSSFQLHDTPGLRPDIGVLTTLSPDHLDRYPSVETYYDDKQRLFANADSASRWVVSADSEEIARRTRALPGKISYFSLRHDGGVDAWYDRERALLMVDGEALMSRSDLALLGDHNVANALAAVLAVLDADPRHRSAESRAKIASALRDFQALPHRMEPVADVDGVQWLNDSKATNVASTLVALEGSTRPTVLLLGGRHKGEPYTALAEPLARIGKAVLCFGEAGERATRDLRDALDALGSSHAVEVQWMHDATFDAVVQRARAIATAGDAVLLSPACSSYDMFPNYVARGERFRALARGTT